MGIEDFSQKGYVAGFDSAQANALAQEVQNIWSKENSTFSTYQDKSLLPISFAYGLTKDATANVARLLPELTLSEGADVTKNPFIGQPDFNWLQQIVPNGEKSGIEFLPLLPDNTQQSISFDSNAFAFLLEHAEFGETRSGLGATSTDWANNIPPEEFVNWRNVELHESGNPLAGYAANEDIRNRPFHALKPPGVGVWSEGDIADNEGNRIDWIQHRYQRDNDGTEHFYHRGQLDNGGLFSDATSFSSEETFTSDHELLSSRVQYSSPMHIKLRGPRPVGLSQERAYTDQTVDLYNVSEIRTHRMELRDSYGNSAVSYQTTIYDPQGRPVYRLVSNQDGDVLSARPLPTDQPISPSPGDMTADTRQFEARHGVYSVVRPPGLAGLKPGQATGEANNEYRYDHRNSQAFDGGDGRTIYVYRGEMNDGNLFNSATNYEGHETVDANGNIDSTQIIYDRATEMRVRIDGNEVSLQGVVSVCSRRREGGFLVTAVTMADGTEMHLRTENGRTTVDTTW